MSTIDSRIVTMKFDNRDFQKGVDTTLSSLGKLGKTLDAGFTSKAVSGLSKVGNSIRNFSFGGMGAQVEGVSGKFLALSTVAVTALATITNKAIHAGTEFAKQFSGLAAAQQGFQEYEEKLGSIQTILANTGLEGQKGLNTVTKALDELNAYSDQTIYNFGEMAKNIGTFTAAGVDLETSVTSIKGIANIAALSGSNAQQASTAMYQLSQAIASGKVGLQDWNSVVNAGMGGKVFQEALANTAVAMGEIPKSAVKLEGPMKRLTVNGSSFRDSISAIGGEKWLTSDVLTNTLSQFSGDLTDAQLKAQGFSEAQIVEIRKIASTAQDAATKVKTFTQLIGTIKEAMGSGWAKTWEVVIGDFGEAKKLFTSVNAVVGGFIQRSADARNKVLEDWKAAGGRDDLLAGLHNLFRVFLKIARPIRNAFRDIFPRTTGKQLAEITENFRKFTEGLLFSREASIQIREVFRGVFTVFKILGIVIGGAIKYVAEFFGILISGGGGSAILAIASAVGRLVTAIGDWLMEGDKLEKFFDMMITARNAVLEPLVGTIGAVVEALVALLSGDTEGFFDKLTESGEHLMDMFGVIGDRIAEFSQQVRDFLQSAGEGGFEVLVATFETLSDVIDTVKDKLNFGGEGIGGFDTGSIDAAGRKVEKLSWIVDVAKVIWDGLTSAISATAGVLGPVSGRLIRFLGNVGDKILTFVETMSFEDLVAIINTGVFVMLYRSITKLADTAGGILGFGDAASGAFDKLTDTLGTMQNTLRAEMIKSLATSVALLAGSLVILSFVPADKMTSALGALSAIIGQVALLMLTMGKLTFGPGVLTIGPTMIGIATGVLVMAGALKALEYVDWESFGKMSAILGVMATSLALMGLVGPGVLAGAAAILIVSPAFVILAGALKALEFVEWESFGKMAAVLGVLTYSLLLLGTMAPMALAGAAAILVMSPAFVILAAALKALEFIDWESIAKFIVVLGTLTVSLTILGTVAPLALAGAAAILVVATAMAVLMPTIQALGAMDIGSIVKALAALVAIFITVGVVGTVLGVVSPLIAAFGIALGIIGVALLAVGAGTLMFATGLTLIAAAGTAAFAVLAGGVTTFLVLLPQWITQFGQAVRAFARVARESGPPVVRAFEAIAREILRTIRRLSPELRKTLVVVIENGLAAIRATFPDFVKTGIQMIMNILNGLDKNMNRLVDRGVDVAVKFMNGIGKNSDRIVRAGKNMVIDLIQAITGEIGRSVGDLFREAQQMAGYLINGLTSAIRDGVSAVVGAISDMASSAIDAARDRFRINSPSKAFEEIGLSLNEGFVGGIDKTSNTSVSAVERMGGGVIQSMRATMSQLGDVMNDGVDLNPTVTPVLDISNVEKNARKMADIIGSKTISAELSLSRAQALVSEFGSRNRQNESDSKPEVVKEVTFNQTNHSPKAISTVEIYRNTKNLLSLKREELGV